MTGIISRRIASGMRAIALAAAVAAGSLASMAGESRAAEHMLGALKLDTPWTRATPPAAKVGGGYVAITNTGSEPDRFVAAAADFAGRVEIHEMKMDGGVMVMRPLADGIEIKPGETVELKPGGFHIMFMMLKEPLVEGETRKVKLMFEKAGEIELDFPVAPVGSKMPAGMDHSGHMQMNQSGN